MSTFRVFLAIFVTIQFLSFSLKQSWDNRLLHHFSAVSALQAGLGWRQQLLNRLDKPFHRAAVRLGPLPALRSEKRGWWGNSEGDIHKSAYPLEQVSIEYWRTAILEENSNKRRTVEYKTFILLDIQSINKLLRCLHTDAYLKEARLPRDRLWDTNWDSIEMKLHDRIGLSRLPTTIGRNSSLVVNNITSQPISRLGFSWSKLLTLLID